MRKLLNVLGSLFYEKKYPVHRCAISPGEQLERFLDEAYDWLCMIGVPIIAFYFLTLLP